MSFAATITRANSPRPSRGVRGDQTGIAVIMVGLPARGKSLIAQKMVRYLKWLSIPSKTFNVGTYRRTATPQPSADFFSTGNTEGERLRHAAAEAAVTDLIAWFERGEGIVAILDATNSTQSRRKWVYDRLEAANIQTLFVESKCDDEALIMSNILEVKTTSPDYVGQDPELAAQDFRNRIRNYEKVYQTIDPDTEASFTYVKLIDIGTRVIINNIRDYLSSRIVYYLMNLHIKPRSIWLSRHGESGYNLEGKLGGDSDISARGEMYARALPALAAKCNPTGARPIVWTSTLKRTIQTARYLVEPNGPSYTKLEWKALDELDSGMCDGLTYEQIEQLYPEDFAARDEDKYNYRYRGGESYRDVVIRLEPVIMELERSENVFIVTHQAVLRCIYAYYMDVPQERSPWLEVPLHTLIKLTPRAYKTHEERFAADIPAVSTFREKGSKARHQRGASLSMATPPMLPRSPRAAIRDGGVPPAGDGNGGLPGSGTLGGAGMLGGAVAPLPPLQELGPPAMALGLGASGAIDNTTGPHGRHLSVPLPAPPLSRMSSSGSTTGTGAGTGSAISGSLDERPGAMWKSEPRQRSDSA